MSAGGRALVVRGGWDGHMPVETTNVFIPFLQQHGFSDPVSVATATGQTTQPEFVQVPVEAGYADAGRGVGLSDLARAIETGRPHRASGELAFHVLDVMESILRAGREHATIELTSTVSRPELGALGAEPWSW